MRIESWDRTTLLEQERVIGRQKGSGAPNGHHDEFDVRHLGKDPGVVLAEVPNSDHCHPQATHEFTNWVNWSVARCPLASM